MQRRLHSFRRPGALLLASLFALLNGCAVGPNYKPPEPPVPPTWSELSSGVTTDRISLARWWTLFDDVVLNQLVDEALLANLPLREATARIDESRARYRIARAAQFPELNFQGSASRNRQSENAHLPGGEGYSDFAVGVAASWELDVFGRVRRSVESASALEDAAEENRRDVMVMLCAEIGQRYIDVRTVQRRLGVAHANLASQEEIYRLTRTRFELGLASGLDVAQAEQVLAATRTVIPPLELELTEQINALSVLLGEPPGALRNRFSDSAPIPQVPDTVGAGLPLDLLRQRPDLRRAERELAAQNARIGVAVGDLYPRFSLLGSIGLDAAHAVDLFEGPSRAYGVGPSVIWNVFDAGRLRAQIRVEESLTEQALLRYEQQLLVALSDVENALAAYGRTREERLAVADAVSANTVSLDLATMLYKDGAVDFQNVLDAQRSLLLQEDRLAVVDGDVVQSVVRLYLALGGGWDVLDDEASAHGPTASTDVPAEPVPEVTAAHQEVGPPTTAEVQP
jgi:NodT family efflux transporter outer membrane factor (OMF) lipoprotein